MASNQQPSRRDFAEKITASYQKITAAWQKAVSSIIETGSLLIAAKEALQHGQFQKMIKNDMPFGVGTAQAFMRIAHHPVLSNAKFIEYLPPAWAVLDELRKVPENELTELIENHKIHPDMTLSDVRNLDCLQYDKIGAALRLLGRFMLNKVPSEQLVENIYFDHKRGVWHEDEVYAVRDLPFYVAEIIVGLDHRVASDGKLMPAQEPLNLGRYKSLRDGQLAEQKEHSEPAGERH